jgi:cation diffusion facilitator family transporter
MAGGYPDTRTPAAFLIALHFRNRSPDATFPYGYHRAGVIAFLCAAVILSALGMYLVIDSGITLLKQEHTAIGGITLMGHTVWLGWLMIAALIYSVIPPFILGRLQERAAEKVHDKTVHVDAKVSKADWMTGAAGIVGVLGVGMGWWWADAAAALVIGLDVSRDGYKNLKEAVGDLMNRRPHSFLRANRKN